MKRYFFSGVFGDGKPSASGKPRAPGNFTFILGRPTNSIVSLSHPAKPSLKKTHAFVRISVVSESSRRADRRCPFRERWVDKGKNARLRNSVICFIGEQGHFHVNSGYIDMHQLTINNFYFR